jgi:hypothetical protein
VFSTEASVEPALQHPPSNTHTHTHTHAHTQHTHTHTHTYERGTHTCQLELRPGNVKDGWQRWRPRQLQDLAAVRAERQRRLCWGVHNVQDFLGRLLVATRGLGWRCARRGTVAAAVGACCGRHARCKQTHGVTAAGVQGLRPCWTAPAATQGLARLVHPLITNRHRHTRAAPRISTHPAVGTPLRLRSTGAAGGGT